MIVSSSAPPSTENTTLLVLCGGEGRRMGGRDKPLMPWRGRAMVDHVLASVPESMPRMVSANRNLRSYRQRGTVVRDKQADLPRQVHAGPLTGVLAGLMHSGSEWLLVAPGDAPNLPADWWPRMRDTAAEQHNHVVAHDGRRQQHLHLLLHRSAEPLLRAYLHSARFQVFLWLEELQPATARFDDAHGFINLNYLEDLQD